MESCDWIHLVQDRGKWGFTVNALMNLRVLWNVWNFVTGEETFGFWRRTVFLSQSVGCLVDCLFSWLIRYLGTFLRKRSSLRWSRNYPSCMPTESSLQCSEEPTFMQVNSSPHLLTLFKIHFNVIFPSTSVSVSLSSPFGFSDWNIVLISPPSRPALEPTHPPYRAFLGVNRPESGVENPPHLAPRLKKK